MRAGGDRLALLVPDFIVVQPPKPPEPPPMPGTVLSIEQLQPPKDPPRPFLVPWETAEASGGQSGASGAAGRSAKASTVASMSANDGTGRSRAAAALCEVDERKLDAYLQRNDVRRVVEAVFKDRGADGVPLIEEVMTSLKDPFRASDSSIVWTYPTVIRPNFGGPETKLGGKKLKVRHKELKGLPWSIASFGDPEGGVRRNLVYDDRGECIAQIDFGHGSTIGIHIHALVEGNLEHTAGNTEDHCFPLREIPWPWLAVPDVSWLRRKLPGWSRCYDSLAAGCGDGAMVTPESGHDGRFSAAAADAASDDDDDPRGERMAFVKETIDGDISHWHSVLIPFEDYLGERSESA